MDTNKFLLLSPKNTERICLGYRRRHRGTNHRTYPCRWGNSRHAPLVFHTDLHISRGLARITASGNNCNVFRFHQTLNLLQTITPSWIHLHSTFFFFSHVSAQVSHLPEKYPVLYRRCWCWQVAGPDKWRSTGTTPCPCTPSPRQPGPCSWVRARYMESQRNFASHVTGSESTHLGAWRHKAFTRRKKKNTKE